MPGFTDRRRPGDGAAQRTDAPGRDRGFESGRARGADGGSRRRGLGLLWWAATSAATVDESSWSTTRPASEGGGCDTGFSDETGRQDGVRATRTTRPVSLVPTRYVW